MLFQHNEYVSSCHGEVWVESGLSGISTTSISSCSYENWFISLWCQCSLIYCSGLYVSMYRRIGKRIIFSLHFRHWKCSFQVVAVKYACYCKKFRKIANSFFSVWWCIVTFVSFHTLTNYTVYANQTVCLFNITKVISKNILQK